MRATYRRLTERARDAMPGATIDGVVVQAMVHDSVAEAILGLSQQPPFGPTILYGLGGIFTEVFEDVAFGVPPFTKAQARAMVERTRGVKLLRGTRGRPAGDLDALVDTIMKLQRLALEVGDDIAELDINPLMVLPKGERRRRGGRPDHPHHRTGVNRPGIAWFADARFVSEVVAWSAFLSIFIIMVVKGISSTNSTRSGVL